MASAALLDKLDSITDDVENIESGINGAFGKINKLFTLIKTGKGNIKDIADIFVGLPNDCLTIKSEVLNLQRLSRNKGFSDYRANSIIDKVAAILRGFPDLKIEKANSRNKWDNLSSICNHWRYLPESRLSSIPGLHGEQELAEASKYEEICKTI